MNKVLVSVPTMGSVHTLLASRLLDWATDQDYQKLYNFSMNESPVDRAREQLVDTFLKTDCTHLFMVDSDTIPPRDAISKLLRVDAPIATGLTPILHFDPKTTHSSIKDNYYSRYNCKNTKDQYLIPDTGVQEVIGAGGSCLLIRRDVIQQVARPLFRNVYEDDNNKKAFISEDIYFVTKARKCGFKTFADTSVLCWHSKNIIF